MLFRRTFVGVSALAAAMPASAHGPGHAMSGGRFGEAGKVARVINVVATDNAFSLKSLQVKDRETVRFVVRNEGFAPHEFIIGTVAEHAEHRTMMRELIERRKKGEPHSMAAMDHASGVWIERDKTATFVWIFARAPNLEFACNIPGHYEDGMKGAITFSR